MRPTMPVQLWLDSWPEFISEFDESSLAVTIGPMQAVSRFDLRPLVGLDVDLFIDAVTPRSSALLDRLKALSPRIMVTVTEWLDRGEVGFFVVDGEIVDRAKVLH